VPVSDADAGVFDDAILIRSSFTWSKEPPDCADVPTNSLPEGSMRADSVVVDPVFGPVSNMIENP
jgi:hypothetical protein